MWVIGAGLVLAVVLQVVGRRPAAAGGQDDSAFKAAPVLTLTTVAGKPLSTRTFLGKVVVVNLWATWCGPCKAEIPALVDLQARLGDHLQVVGLAYDETPAGEIAAFATKFGINYPVAVIGPDEVDQFGRVEGLPMSFLVDQNGRIVRTYLGMLNVTALERDIGALL